MIRRVTLKPSQSGKDTDFERFVLLIAEESRVGRARRSWSVLRHRFGAGALTFLLLASPFLVGQLTLTVGNPFGAFNLSRGAFLLHLRRVFFVEVRRLLV